MPFFAVFQVDLSRMSTVDQAHRDYLGRFEADDAFLAARKAAFGGRDGDPTIHRVPMGEYEVYPVEGSAAFGFELNVRALSRDGEQIEEQKL